MSSPARPASFAALFATREFRVLWLAGTQSQLGDQLARVALSILVFDRTGSGLATAATYALTYLPAMVGGVLLAGLADTLPRRGLLATCDLVRAALFAVMALPGVPLWLLCCLVVVAVLAGAPYNAAEPAIVADIFTGDEYVAANGLRTATSQAAQLIGFGAGGALVALIGARTALAIDAATFLASAALLRAGLANRAVVAAEARGGLKQLRIGVRTVAADRRLRVLLALAWLNAFWIVPEGLAAPYAASHGGGPTSVGILLAAAPAGNVIGVIVLTRWVRSSHRLALLRVLAVATGVPLIVCVTDPAVGLAVVLWGASGVAGAYLVLVVTEYVAIVAPRVRGQAIGLASSGLQAAQGIGLLVGGALTSVWSVGVVIGVTAAAGCVLALPLVAGKALPARG